MKVSRTYVYALIVTVLAVTYGVLLGPLWVTDAFVLGFLAVGVMWFSLSRKDRGNPRQWELKKWPASATVMDPEPEEKKQVPRSRIAHYVFVSGIKSTASVAKSYGAFERTLLSDPKWQKLSGESLNGIIGKARDEAALDTKSDAS